MTKRPDYPLSARLQWYLARSKPLAYTIDCCVQRPYTWWQRRRWENRRTPSCLVNAEARTYSQNGEDGIIAEIFSRIGEGDKFVVEFGAQNGAECCSRNLIMNQGWKALLIDGSEKGVIAARRLYAEFPSVTVSRKFIRVDNILDIFQSYKIPKSPDLLVIDIDGNDYWIWKEILTVYRPRAVVIEYNGKWGPARDWIMPYRPDHHWDGSANFGASLSALTRLGERSGYVLVGCDSRGINAFFVRGELVQDKFPNHNAGARFHYVPPGYSRGLGYPYRSSLIRK
ncbi:MAG: hypothetical protein AAF699_18480 [Pseudomonadota bacterium]